jgi:hypothetical protein
MNDILRAFNGDVHTKEALKAYIDNFIGQEGVRRIFDREDVSAVADAKELIDKMFEQLEIDYGIPKPKKEHQNESR